MVNAVGVGAKRVECSFVAESWVRSGAISDFVPTAAAAAAWNEKKLAEKVHVCGRGSEREGWECC